MTVELEHFELIVSDMNLMSVLCSQRKIISFVIAKYWYLNYPSNESSVKLDFNLHKNAFYWIWVHVAIAFLALCTSINRFNRLYHGNLNYLNYWPDLCTNLAHLFTQIFKYFGKTSWYKLWSYMYMCLSWVIFFFTSIASNLRRKKLYIEVTLIYL